MPRNNPIVMEASRIRPAMTTADWSSINLTSLTAAFMPSSMRERTIEPRRRVRSTTGQYDDFMDSLNDLRSRYEEVFGDNVSSIHIDPKKWQQCKRCETEVLKRTVTKVSPNHGFWCVACVVEHAIHTGGREGKWVPKTYFDEKYTRCHDCKWPMPRDKGCHEYIETTRKNERIINLCGDCYGFRDRTRGKANPVLRYNGDPSQQVKMLTHPAKDGLNIGVELEIEVRQGDKVECARKLLDVLNKDDVCIKHDGSLANGFEVVTAANSLAYTKEVLQRLFSNREAFIPWRIAAWGMATCGLHVHISRAPMTDLQIGKMVAFVHHPMNRALIRKLAGRDSNKKYGGYDDFKDHHEVMRIPFGSHSDYRYTAVNITNYYTVEIRIFKGTLNKTRVFADIEFTHALAKYSAPCNSSILESVRGAGFLAWLNSNIETYPNLVQFLQRNDFLQE